MSERDKPFHEASTNPVGQWVVNRLLIQPAISRMFGGVYMYIDPGSFRMRSCPDIPLIYCSTHVSWWDGYMASVVNRKAFKRTGYLMMEEVNLARYWFLTWAGVFGVDRDDPRKALDSIKYIVGKLTEESNRALWMFPQGTIAHPDVRPLTLYGGVANVARKVGQCAIVPVALRYEFYFEQAPDAYIRVGPALMLDGGNDRVSSKEITLKLREAMEQNDDALHAELVSRKLAHYQRVVAGRTSANKVWDSFVGLVKGTRDGKEQ